MSVPPKGAGPRGTLPLGIGLALPSPYASRHVEREGRTTARPPALGPRALRQAHELHAHELPEWEGFDGPDSESEPEPAVVAPHRSAQGWGDVAKAPRAPALRAPVRLREQWPVAGAILTALGAVGIVGLVVNMYRGRVGDDVPPGVALSFGPQRRLLVQAPGGLPGDQRAAWPAVPVLRGGVPLLQGSEQRMSPHPPRVVLAARVVESGAFASPLPGTPSTPLACSGNGGSSPAS